MVERRGTADGAIIALVALMAGCAHDVKARLPSPPGEPTGTIVILLTQPARDLTVAIDGTLVANRRHTKKLTVTGVPTGLTDVVIAAGGGSNRVERHLQVYVEIDRKTVIPLGSPEQSMTSAMHFGMLSVVAWVLSRAIYLAFL